MESEAEEEELEEEKNDERKEDDIENVEEGWVVLLLQVYSAHSQREGSLFTVQLGVRWVGKVPGPPILSSASLGPIKVFLL